MTWEVVALPVHPKYRYLAWGRVDGAIVTVVFAHTRWGLGRRMLRRERRDRNTA